MNQSLIAPCGMNCSICLGYQREKNACGGCRNFSENTPGYCRSCIIINCETIKSNKSGFCYECDLYPCKRLKQLDKRYRTKYNMSMLENLESIKTIGLKRFIENEQVRWKCDICGESLCVHREVCLTCKKN